MNNNRNSYMNQNISANQRSLNMRGGCGCQNAVQGQRSVQGDCGCTGNAGPGPVMQRSYTQRSVQGDCGCTGNAGPVIQNGYAKRSAQNECGCADNTGYASAAEMPTGNRASLLAYIDQVSFAAYEAALYLDTHPDCQNGLQYFRDHNEKRNLALKEYAKLYGPLTLAQADESCDAYWQWVNQPWPWEGGNC